MIWELIRSNQRKSVALFFFLGLLIVTMGFVFGVILDPRGDPTIIIFVSLIIWLAYSALAYFGGPDWLLRVSAARQVTADTDRRLFNVVEEMKIAAGLPTMPKIYIMNEDAMNALAVGRNPENSSIVVTSGLLSRLDRDELQGVVAHELSHIINRDALFMTFAGAALGSVALLSNLFWRSLGFARFKSKSSRDASGIVVFWILALALAAVGVVLAQIFYFAIARKREYLADASAARLTRYPQGLASALEKIDDSAEVLVHFNDITAPMFIANPVHGKRFEYLIMNTHPPIKDRIKILRRLSGASYKDYQLAYSSVMRKRLISNRILNAEREMPLRQPLSPAPAESRIDIKRSIGDTLLAADDFIFLNCACGLKIKVPPQLDIRTIDCPRCGHRFAGSLKAT